MDRAGAELSVLVCDDDTIEPLNLQWRGVGAPTDVLSFPQEDDLLLGDVVISVTTATRQAESMGHPVWVELRVLLTHGVLHLVGHDHHEPEETATMRAEEHRLLVALGISDDQAGLVTRNRGG